MLFSTMDLLSSSCPVRGYDWPNLGLTLFLLSQALAPSDTRSLRKAEQLGVLVEDMSLSAHRNIPVRLYRG